MTRNLSLGFCGLALAAVALVSLVATAQAQQDPPKDGEHMHQHGQQPARNMHAGYFGAKLGPIDEDMAKDLKLESQDGIVIIELLPGSPAEKAGIQVHDVIRKVDGKDVDDVQDFISSMESTHPDQVMKFTIIRDSKEQEISVTLGTRPANMGMPNHEEPKHDEPPTTQGSK